MRYAIEPRDRTYVKGYGFLSFAKNRGKNFSNKYSKKLLDSANESATDAIKTASKEQFKKQQKQLAILSIPKLLIKLTSVSRSCTQ